MEVYVDDMLMKSMSTEDQIGHLREMFRILRKYHIKLNSLKYTFEKFLGYMSSFTSQWVYSMLNLKRYQHGKLYVDGSSGKARAGTLLISPDGHNLKCALHLEFKASNNAVEYETLLAGLRLA
ncbi:Ribonuclease H [Abeliophyllum distichum]|uniref:Ribonuclease H n=1 Tax=Abeliophyllum distichum TaxID=126358 RepID=A0ABD1RUL2_9LAMI